jgi:hypothetical protein
VYTSSFIMSGGVISGNSSGGGIDYGGGGGVFVFVYGNSINSDSFSKTGGIIYGSDADGSLANTTSSGNTYGHAVRQQNDRDYAISPFFYRYRDITLNAGDNLSTSSNTDWDGTGSGHI